MMRLPRLLFFALPLCTAGWCLPAFASPTPRLGVQPAVQDEGERTLVVEPAQLELLVGESAQIQAWVVGPDGERTDEEVLFFSRARRSVTVDENGQVQALVPGDFELMARTRRSRSGDSDASGQEGRAALGKRLTTRVPVRVQPQPVAQLELKLPEQIYQGTRIEIASQAIDAAGNPYADVQPAYTTSDANIVSVDEAGYLHAHGTGKVELTAQADEVIVMQPIEVLANPIARIEVTPSAEQARTGDVLRFAAQATDAQGAPVEGVPIELSVMATPDDDLGPRASGQILADGRFVAEDPGRYTVWAASGSVAGQATVRIDPREVQSRFEFVGHGRVSGSHTSDLWVWEGIDGRDYAVTGTWGANGDAIFWDVTDPAEIEEIARVTVDARTVNDVKVSPDGRLCVISREGASNRKNGVVLIDVENPREPKVMTAYDDELTGGVHNLFITESEVYALSAGRRYDVLDISDRRSPRKIASYEVESVGHSIHDVWIDDGLAYSSNWSDGVHIVDVGNGMRGGSPDNPTFVASYAYPSGWNHAAFPYFSQDTGRFYVVAGDEAFPHGLNVTGKPTYPRGWLHFIDFTDLEKPEEIARYQVPEAGTHNLWIEGDICYVAYYNAGLRALDISGELMGDLYQQGREIAWYLPDDPEGHIPNAPMAWGPQPYKGNVFFSDWNSGLWCVKLIRD